MASSTSVMLPSAVIGTGQAEVDVSFLVPTSAFVSGVRVSVQAGILRAAGWGLTNVERMVLVY